MFKINHLSSRSNEPKLSVVTDKDVHIFQLRFIQRNINLAYHEESINMGPRDISRKHTEPVVFEGNSFHRFHIYQVNYSFNINSTIVSISMIINPSST